MNYKVANFPRECAKSVTCLDTRSIVSPDKCTGA